jgi:hypothetical protein
MFHRDARPGVRDAHVELAVDGFGRGAHFAGISELDGVVDKLEQHLGEALLVAEANG